MVEWPALETQIQALQNQVQALDRAISARYETPEGQRCLESDVVQWFSIDPVLCRLIWKKGDLEGRLYFLSRKAAEQEGRSLK